jgi:hypothetical protein
MTTPAEQARRWRLILGRYADTNLAGVFEAADAELDRLLGFLYDREYEGRGHRIHSRPRSGGQGGGRERSSLTAVNWLERSRELFPKDTFERLQNQAIERYGVTELLAKPDVAQSLQPSPELGAALVSMRGKLSKELQEGLRIVIRKVVEDIVARLKAAFIATLIGRRDRFRRSYQPQSQNFDWRGTVRANLTHYDQAEKRLMIDEARFISRVKRHLTWDVILLVDQSGSMSESVLYSAVCASIMAGLPGINVRLLLFDTAVVDFTHLALDPVEVLMTAQLGGGTDIAGAVGLAETLVTSPRRTVLVLISDFEEGGSIPSLLDSVSRLRGAGVTMLGLAALNYDAEPVFDHHVGGMLADRGMNVAALTPEHLAEWLAEVMR